MARFTTVFLAAVASLTPLVSAGCSVDIINFNQVSVGNGCIPEGGQGGIWVESRKQRYFVDASDTCGVGLKTQVLPADWSLQYKGKC